MRCAGRESVRGARAIPVQRTLKTIQSFPRFGFSNSCLERSLTFSFSAFLKLLSDPDCSGRIDLGLSARVSACAVLPRKEVIQPHLPIRLPCYDFTPVIGLALGGWLLPVTSPTLGTPNSHGVTGGVYKARERIHRGMLIRDY